MWDAVSLKNTTAPKAGDNFALEGTRVPKQVPRPPTMPMTQIWQNAVKFDAKLETRLQDTAARKALSDRKALADQKLANAKTNKATPNPAQNSRVSDRAIVRWTATPADSTNRSTSMMLATPATYRPAEEPVTAYNAQGAGLRQPTAETPRPGSLLDVLL